MASKVPMATKFQWELSFNGNNVPMDTKFPMAKRVPTVPMATKRSLAVLASYEIWACYHCK